MKTKLRARVSLQRFTKWVALASIAAVTVSSTALVFAGNNPQPNTGSPHGTGISHTQYPNGYKLNGQFAASFNNYIDYSDGSPNDERNFMGARVLSPNPNPPSSFETRKKLPVKAGDTVLVSMFIHNDAGASGNNNGSGPSVAKNTRVGINFPSGQTGTELNIGSFVYADNAVVNEQDLSLHTISDNMSFTSVSGQPIKLSYQPGSTRLLQSLRAKDPSSTSYQIWNFSQHQEFLFQSTTRVAKNGNVELVPSTGISVGHDGKYTSATAVGLNAGTQLGWFGCDEFHGYVQFRMTVSEVPVPPSPTPTPPVVTPTVPPSATPVPAAPLGPPSSGVLPKTGGTTAALVSLAALLISGYLLIRERRTLAKVRQRSRLN